MLVVNKLDLVPPEERDGRVAALVRALRWKGPVLRISALTGDGTRELTYAVQAWLDEHPAGAATAAHGEGVTEEPILLKPAPVTPRRRRAAP